MGISLVLQVPTQAAVETCTTVTNCRQEEHCASRNAVVSTSGEHSHALPARGPNNSSTYYDTLSVRYLC